MSDETRHQSQSNNKEQKDVRGTNKGQNHFENVTTSTGNTDDILT